MLPFPQIAQDTEDRILVFVDASKPGSPLRHVWPFFGFDECNFAVTADARDLMKALASSQVDLVYIRCHFLLNTGNGVPALKWGSTNVYNEDALGNPVYDWTIMDKIMDAIVQTGTTPLVEIGFMPKALSVRPEPYQHIYPPDQWAGWAYPPKDYSKWAALIRELAKHNLSRYGAIEQTWLWELWNEPDIFYWQGTFEEYRKLFDYTENALHNIFPRAVLGGPHTTSPAYKKPATFLHDFLKHCLKGINAATGKKGTRLDYVGFHSKGSTELVDGHPRMNLGLNLANNRAGFGIVAEFPEYKNTPIIIGECDPEGLAARSSSVHPANGYRNGSAYAAYEAALMKHTIDLAEREGVNLKGVLTWAFMFEGKDYFEGFRTLATNGIHKPVLNVFKMLGMFNGKRIPLASSAALGADKIIAERVIGQPDIDGLAAGTETTTQVMVWNYHDDIAPAPAAPLQVSIQAPNSSIKRARLIHYRIDDEHSNAYTKWLQAGSPKAPSPAQLAALKKAGELERLGAETFFDVKDELLILDFELPRHAVSFIEIRWLR
jgi:xylan 1,4-beta-xylosidase